MSSGRFKAARVDVQSAQSIQKTVALSSLFQSRLSETPKKPLPPSIQASGVSEQVELEEKVENLLS